MSDVDEEVRMAEQMALAVASAPNLRASEAKEMMLSKSQSALNRSMHNQRRKSRLSGEFRFQQEAQGPSNRERLDSADEEVRRAREMAMAVAALGTEKGSMKAEDIRMAVANVMTDPNERVRKRKQGGNRSTEKETSDNFEKGTKPKRSPMGTIMEEMIRPPWILRNQSLFAMVALTNFLILYVTLSSEPSYTKISNAMFIFNTAVSFFCVLEKRNPENITKDQSNTDGMGCPIHDEDGSNERQEELVNEMEKRLASGKTITLEWLPNVHYSETDLQSLQDLQPGSTLAERRRFLKARKGVIKAASAQLGSYLEWRSANKIDEFFTSTFTTDEEDWALAARGAMEIANTSDSPAKQRTLPRVVSVFGGKDGLVLCKNGARIVHVLPSQLDTSIAPATTYALALAMYLDRKLDRNHTEKVTVVIDIRSGKGWPNPSSVSLVPFIKLVVGSLNSYFPERLSKCILFPLPMTATVLFNKAKSYLDPDTASKIQVCSGAGSVNSKVPDKVKTFIEENSIFKMERRRKELFLK